MAMVYRDRGTNDEEVERLFREACQRITTLDMRAQSCLYLGKFLVSHGKDKEAHEYLEESLQLRQKAFEGKKSIFLLEIMDELIPLKKRLGLNKESDELRKLAREIRERNEIT